MVIGSSLAVHAIAHGRDAAKEILGYISDKNPENSHNKE